MENNEQKFELASLSKKELVDSAVEQTISGGGVCSGEDCCETPSCTEGVCGCQ